jgi:hypothetical protein
VLRLGLRLLPLGRWRDISPLRVRAILLGALRGRRRNITTLAVGAVLRLGLGLLGSRRRDNTTLGGRRLLRSRALRRRNVVTLVVVVLRGLGGESTTGRRRALGLEIGSSS